MPVCQLAHTGFDSEIELINDTGIEPHPGHQDKMTARMSRAVERAERNSCGYGVEKLSGGAVGAGTQSDFVGQHVRSTGRQGSEWDFRASHAIDGLVDGAIAASGENEVAPLSHREARQFARFIGSWRGKKLHFVTRAQEYLHRIVQAGVFAASKAAGKRVINDADSMARLSDNLESRRTRL
jgi:hypothetical protein